MINNLPERQIIKLWQHQLLGRNELTAEGGESIRIIYPGRVNDEKGPDFRDAVIDTDGELIKGDIEIHVRSGGWLSHGHHHDPAYNGLILHVVMWHDAEVTTNLQNGKRVPILAIHKYISPISQSPHLTSRRATVTLPCREAVEHSSPGIIAKSLDTAGGKRFLAKASQFQADLAQMEASQCLYQGIMGALGYSKNKPPFLELARRLPLKRLESMTQGKILKEECLTRQQALLLGTAGLLPSQRQHWQAENKDKWTDQCEKLWASCHQDEAMSEGDWHLFRVRPTNFPPRRIAAMSHLIFRYKQRGIFTEIVNMINEVPLNREYQQLEQGLAVTSNGYWANHFDLGVDSRINNPTLLGSQRAADIIVNIVLPFTFAWGKATSQPRLASKALSLYGSYRKLVSNSIERHMSQQLGLNNSLVVNSAWRQQGLIHIYNTLCTQGRCGFCPLSQFQAGHHI